MRFLALALWLLLCAPAHAQYNCGIGLANTLGIPGLSCQTSLDYSLLGPTLQSGFVFSRASSATFWNGSALATAGANVPRFDAPGGPLGGYGLLLEGQSTNGVRNNTMVGAVVGTPGTLPTGWGWGTNGSGLVWAVSGVGTENGISYVDLNLSGTSTLSSQGYVYFSGTQDIASANGQVWTGSFFVRQSGGATTNVSGIQTALGSRIAGGGASSWNAFSANSLTPLAAASLGAGSLTVTGTIADASNAYVWPQLHLNHGTGPVNITLRVGAPQAEQLASASSVILTAGSAVTRAADLLYLPLSAIPWFIPANGGTIFANYNTVAASSLNQSIVGLYDSTGGFTNYLDLFSQNGVGTTYRSQTGVYLGSGDTITPGANSKSGISWGPSGYIKSANGDSPTSSGTTSIPSGLQYLVVGTQANGGLVPLGGHIQRLQLLNRQLPSSALQAGSVWP